MKNFFKASILFSLFSVVSLNAQQVVEKDTIAGTEVSISMDSQVKELLDNMEENCLLANTRKTTRSDNDNTVGSGSNSGTPTTRPSTRTVPNRALTNAEICRQNPRILGYKIQLVVVKSNEEANEVKAYFRRRFPNIKAETDASLRPNYKILVGSYFTRQSASADLARIKQYFKSALPVQYRVFCVEAK